ncbi:MAG TPA: FAD-dependent oxidoreductase [Mycobacteriales bacterium]|nr:FAD-dependent oxidoreductase [Mycobacteriales bacterium]
MNPGPTFVIVGAGLAGAKAAETLRGEGFEGTIVLLGEETERPYERPPLSKGYLLGTEDKSKIYVHDAGWYAEHEVELRTGSGVAEIDRARKEVVLVDGDRVHYDRLLLATGSEPRRLPGPQIAGVHYLRRVEDSEALRAAMHGGGRCVVVGAGWIGLESAAAARHHGCLVTMIEPQPTPLHAVLGAELGTMFGELHAEHGVDLRVGTGLAEIVGSDGAVSAVVTSTGERIPADLVVVGIGIRPRTELAEAAGLAVDNGILVDAALRTSDPDIFAAGDVANAAHPTIGRRLRVEHWANALHGGPAAARSMLGHDVVYDRVPYFFSDQYDLGMEFSGWLDPGGYDEVVYRGDRKAREFIAFWLQSGRVQAGMNVNVWDVTPAIQGLIRLGRVTETTRLADPSVPLDGLAG